MAQTPYNWSQTPQSGLPQQTLQQWYASILPRHLTQPKGSAIDSKGVLAVAGACGGSGTAPLVARYLKEWYGLRGAQCKALVQMLAWVEHPAAIQVLLAVGSRFRTKGIQDEAARQVQAVAARKGWTLEELADRTIPSAGLDENGEMTLDYGARQFSARLGDDLELVLRNSEGKILSSLPDPRTGDDEERAKEAKKLLSASRKELKSALRIQAERLYEAMCTQRSWSFDDWSRYLNRHPIVRHLCGRLVWIVLRDGAPALTFRPLADGTLTDVAEGTVTLSAGDAVRLAHDCNTPSDVAQSWGTHFADYEVEPLFQQLGRPRFALSEEKKQAVQLDDFQGHTLNAFALRGRATKLGYTRGQTQDGGWFYTYLKRFPTLGLAATLEFTGNSLPEENRKVALRALSFSRIVAGNEPGGHSPLGEIPAALLAETWNDLRSIAAEGSGFDPDWEKKTGS